MSEERCSVLGHVGTETQEGNSGFSGLFVLGPLVVTLLLDSLAYPMHRTAFPKNQRSSKFNVDRLITFVKLTHASLA